MQTFLEVIGHLCKNFVAWIMQNQYHLTKHLFGHEAKSYFHVFNFRTKMLDFEYMTTSVANLSQQQ